MQNILYGGPEFQQVENAGLEAFLYCLACIISLTCGLQRYQVVALTLAGHRDWYEGVFSFNPRGNMLAK
jgi:hypothetical protein